MFEKIRISKEKSKLSLRSQAKINYDKGKYFYHMKEIKRAEEYLTEAEKYLDGKKIKQQKYDESELKLEGEILFTKGDVMKDKGKYELALNYYEKCL